MESFSGNVPTAPLRAFVAALGITASAQDPIGPFRRTYGLEAVLSRVLDSGLWFLGAAGASLELSRVGMGLPGSSERPLSSPVPRSDISMLPYRLHVLKNGDQAGQARYSDLQALFTELAPGHRFELRSEQGGRGEKPPEHAFEIEVFPSDTTAKSVGELARPLRFAGTGVEQALVIAETLVGNPERLLILDEPASNLHPPWQRIVRSHLCTREGQCLLVTHSPYLIPSDNAEQLATVVRFGLRHGATHTYRLTQEDLADDRWVGTMVKELAWSADARGLLFAGGVVLVEGETELGALPAWFSRSPAAVQYRGPDDVHVVFYSVGGDQSFHSFIAYLQRFGVPWAVICDGAAFRFDRGRHIFEQVLEAGIDDHRLATFVAQEITGKNQDEMDESVFSTMVLVGRDHGIFTLAAGWHHKNDLEGNDESFESYLASKSDLASAFHIAKVAAPRSKPRAGRLLAEATACPPEVSELYRRILDTLWDQGMAKYPSHVGAEGGRDAPGNLGRNPEQST
jgi:hypothetical protein